MLTLTTRAAVEAAIHNATLDPQLRTLLALRKAQLERDTEPDLDLGDLVHFHVAGEGDVRPDVEATLGFPIADPEWIEDHGGIWEMAFVFTDDGFGHVLFVPDRDGIDPTLLALCRTMA